MLLAFVLGGLAAALAAPVLLSSEEDDDGDGVPSEPEIEETPAPDDSSGSDELGDIGKIFEIPVASGNFEISDFNPDCDSCTLLVEDTDAMIETGIDALGTSYLRTETAEGDMVITFEGLDEVPSDAVHFVVPHDAGGPMTLSLTEILDLGAGGDDGTSMVAYSTEQGDDADLTHLDDTLEDVSTAILVLPEIGDVADDAFDLLDELIPLTPEGGDVADHATDPIDATAAIAPVEGDSADPSPDPIEGSKPLAPVTDDFEKPG